MRSVISLPAAAAALPSPSRNSDQRWLRSMRRHERQQKSKDAAKAAGKRDFARGNAPPSPDKDSFGDSNSFGMRCYSFFCLIGRQKTPRFSIRLLRVVVRPRLRCGSKQVCPNSVQHFLIAKISLGNSLSPRLPIKRSTS